MLLSLFFLFFTVASAHLARMKVGNHIFRWECPEGNISIFLLINSLKYNQNHRKAWHTSHSQNLSDMRKREGIQTSILV